MTVKTKYGLIEGIEQEGYTEYFGIPYAKPPVGERRWKAPVEMEPWEGIFRAVRFADSSMQPQNREEGFYGKEFRDDPKYVTAVSEDSLYLNIWTPAKSAKEKLPVAFWIHGGAFMGGCGHEKEFDGQAYCKRGVILVTINYRLSIWGFLAHPWLSSENERHVSGNYGILDQIAALKWVRENIEAFGGDPDRITVFGQSAGAMSTQTLVSSVLTGNMISRAIMQSGGGYANGLNRDDITLEVQEAYGLEFSSLAGVTSLEQMRCLSSGQILELLGAFMDRVMPEAHGLFLVPNIDGYVLESGYDRLADEGKLKNIPYMLGSNKDDLLVTQEQKELGEYSSLYKGCVEFSRKLEQNGQDAAYVYYFKRDLPGDQAGAFHSAELWYTFGTLDRAWRPFTEHDRELSNQMLSYWTNFMKYGNPNGEGISDWKRCTCESPYVKQFE